MITKQQKQWLDHLNDQDKVIVKPYDPESEKIFEEVKEKVITCLGNGFEVLHRGASHLKISGQDEIDIYVPVEPNIFDETVTKIKDDFGEPGSLYPLVRARFRIDEYTKHIDVFVINKKDVGWTDSEIFTKYLLSHSNILEEYRQLKEAGRGLSTKTYYTQKIEFINNVLVKAKQEC